MTDVKLGALCWNQYTDWASLLEAGVRADRLGYDTLWTWDPRLPGRRTVMRNSVSVGYDSTPGSTRKSMSPEK